MIRLGMRLATAGGRGAVAGLALTAAAVAVGTAILLFALSFAPAVEDRDGRIAWRESYVKVTDGSTGTLVLALGDRVGAHVLARIHVAPAPAGSGAERPGTDRLPPGVEPLPPGIDALPRPGTSYVSPALAALMSALPADELAGRFGRVVGTIGEEALASPDDLVAIVGNEPAALRAQGALTVEGFATQPPPLALPPVGMLIVILAAVGALTPVAVFVATATRLSAARRESRLAALRLVGATPRQVGALAVVEALIATSAGAVGGVVLFFLGRGVVARIPLDDMTWWPSSIAPPLSAAVALLVAVQVVGAAAALVAMRRLTVSPLGVQRRSTPGAPTARRLLPLVLATVALLLAIGRYRQPDGADNAALVVAGLSFAAVIGGIVLAGPWLTAGVGRAMHRHARGASTLLAARRIGDEPRASFGAIAGVIMAVFVTSAFFTFAAYAGQQAGRDFDPVLDRTGVRVDLGLGARSGTALAEQVRDIHGVSSVLEVRSVALVERGAPEQSAWVIDCGALIEAVPTPGATCARSGVTTIGSDAVVGDFVLVADAPAPIGTEPRPVGLRVARGESRPLVPSAGPTLGFLPPVLIDPRILPRGSLAALPPTRLYVATDGHPATGERVRTAAVAAVPSGSARLAGDVVANDNIFEEIGRIVALGLVGSLALGGCSLAVAVTTATLERRRQFVLLRSAGMPASGLRHAILLQAGAPLLAVASFSAVLGVALGIAVLSVADAEPVVPGASLLVTLVASLLVAMAVVVLTLPPLERMTRPESLRHE